jgi:hypothetical protein
MAVAWPVVRARLAADLPGVLPGVKVYDGPPVTGERPSAYLTIAAQPSRGDDSGGSFTQDVGPDGFSALEAGSVLCELAGVTGSTTVPDVFASFDAIAAHVQADQTLAGALLPGSTVTVSADVEQAQNTSGAVQRLLVTVTYTTRLP